VVLHYVLNRKVPVLKFFIKDQLKWIPFLGFAWWAMGCPYMKRYSKEYLAKNPHKEGKDKKSTLKAIETFKKTPASVMNFIEGTRFTPAKQKLQSSPYINLLRPKAGGIGFVIGAMAEHFENLLDITIVYPDAHHSLWDFLCKRMDCIQVYVRELPIPQEFRTQALTEQPDLQSQFRDWLNEQWAQKDLMISQTRQG
jgi:1-acyl-sn-glycerol-3-phosphate acyltransferase